MTYRRASSSKLLLVVTLGFKPIVTLRVWFTPAVRPFVPQIAFIVLVVLPPVMKSAKTTPSIAGENGAAPWKALPTI